MNLQLMIAITSHYIDPDFIYHEDLSFYHIPTSHTGVNLATHIHDILHEFNIHTKLFCITIDSTSNNGKMMKELSKLLRKHDSIKWNGPAHHIQCLALLSTASLSIELYHTLKKKDTMPSLFE